MLDVVIAVKEPLVRMGLEAVLGDAETTRVAHVAADVAELEEGLSRFGRAVVILDVRYRQANPELVPRIVRTNPRVRVLVLVAHSAEECAVRHLAEEGDQVRLSYEAMCDVDECCLMSLRNEAHGCLAREAEADDVVEAVTRAAAGEVVAEPWLTVFRRNSVAQNPSADVPTLTPRELDVMGLLAGGLGNKAIARKLGIKEQTVKNYVARIMSKTGLSNRVQVGLLAARYHLQSRRERG